MQKIKEYKYYIMVSFISFVFGVSLTMFFYLLRAQVRLHTTTRPTTILETTAADDNEVITQEMPSRIIEAPNKKNSLLLYVHDKTPESGDYACRIKIYKNTQIVDLDNIINGIDCTDYIYLDSQHLIGWMGDNNIILELQPGELTIVNIDTLTTNIFTYDHTLKEVHTTYDMHFPENKIMFRIIDAGKKQTLSLVEYSTGNVIRDFNFEILDEDPNAKTGSYVDAGAYFDAINNGLLFMQRYYVGETAETTAYFYNLDTQTYKQVFYNKPVISLGRGCNAPRIVTKQKGIVGLYTGYCFVLDEGVINEDGEVYFNL